MTYDQWKTTPPDWMWEEPEDSREDVEDQWLEDTWDDGWLAAFEASNDLRAASGCEAPAGNRFTVWGPAQ